jgi:histone H3/H4
MDDDQSAASSNPAVAEEYTSDASDNEEAPMASVVAGTSIDNDSADEKEDLDVTVDDDSVGTGDNSSVTPVNRKRSLSEASPTPPGMTDSGKKRKKYNDGQPRKPAVRDLTLPYRSIKRTMKLDPSVGIVQNDAAYLVTYATELFIKKLAKDSQELALKKGRSIIKYDDLAEARAKTKAFSFLDMLIP